jgi:hypothetical protein
MHITYGNGKQPIDYVANINVAVINGDVGSNAMIGGLFPTLQTAFKAPYGFTVSYLDPAAFTFSQAEDLVDSGAYWAVWYIQPTASATLAAALPVGSTTPNAPSIRFIYDAARGPGYVTGLLKKWSAAFAATYNTLVSTALLKSAAQSGAKFSAYTPSALMTPVTSLDDNLHVLKTYSGVDGAVSGSGIAQYLGMIVQIIIINAAHDPLRVLGVRYDHRILAKAFHFAMGAIFVSFWPAITLVWFQVEMTPATFFTFWAMEGLGMAAFGCMVSSSATTVRMF